MRTGLAALAALGLAAYGQQAVTGVWRGQMDGLPAITLTLSDESGVLAGAIVFHMIRRDDGQPPRSTPGSPEPMFGLRMEGQSLHFDVSHRRAHGDRTSGDPPVHFVMRFTGPDEASLGDSVGLKRDPQPVAAGDGHKVQFVTVEEGVKLEVLDWGGAGRSIVLLAGYQTAHVFDDFAPRLSAVGHVYGITRRGFGASSTPETGYTSHRLAEDVVAVLDALHLERPVLVGHSFGGQDQTTVAMMKPNRIGGLVYLNSAEDPLVRDYGVEPPSPSHVPASMRRAQKPDLNSFNSYRAWQKRVNGTNFPEHEFPQIYQAKADGSVGEYRPAKVRQLIFKGLEPVNFAAIKVPVLAFFAGPKPLAEEIEHYAPANEDERAAIEQAYRYDLAIRLRHIDDLLKGVPTARVLIVPGANFYIFLANESDLLPEMHQFIRGLK